MGKAPGHQELSFLIFQGRDSGPERRGEWPRSLRAVGSMATQLGLFGVSQTKASKGIKLNRELQHTFNMSKDGYYNISENVGYSNVCASFLIG